MGVLGTVVFVWTTIVATRCLAKVAAETVLEAQKEHNKKQPVKQPARPTICKHCQEQLDS